MQRESRLLVRTAAATAPLPALKRFLAFLGAVAGAFDRPRPTRLAAGAARVAAQASSIRPPRSGTRGTSWLRPHDRCGLLRRSHRDDLEVDQVVPTDSPSAQRLDALGFHD